MSRRDPEAFLDSYSALKKRLTALVSQAYARAEIGAMQARLVRQIGRASPISQAELARATNSDAPLTGRAVQALVERGFVRRARSTEDRREYVLALTPAGRRLFDRVTALRAELAAEVVAALDDRDLDDFARITGKILAATEPGEA